MRININIQDFFRRQRRARAENAFLPIRPVAGSISKAIPKGPDPGAMLIQLYPKYALTNLIESLGEVERDRVTHERLRQQEKYTTFFEVNRAEYEFNIKQWRGSVISSVGDDLGLCAFEWTINTDRSSEVIAREDIKGAYVYLISDMKVIAKIINNRFYLAELHFMRTERYYFWKGLIEHGVFHSDDNTRRDAFRIWHDPKPGRPPVELGYWRASKRNSGEAYLILRNANPRDSAIYVWMALSHYLQVQQNEVEKHKEQ